MIVLVIWCISLVCFRYQIGIRITWIWNGLLLKKMEARLLKNTSLRNGLNTGTFFYEYCVFVRSLVVVSNDQFVRRPWEKAVTVPGNSTKATVPDLDEGQEYEFRVTAVNKGGPGKPSDASEIVITKPRFRKYFDLCWTVLE